MTRGSPAEKLGVDESTRGTLESFGARVCMLTYVCWGSQQRYLSAPTPPLAVVMLRHRELHGCEGENRLPASWLVKPVVVARTLEFVTAAPPSGLRQSAIDD